MLRFKSKAGSTLPRCADSEIRDKSGRFGLHGDGSVTMLTSDYNAIAL
jgi:hypothetical protein